MARSDAVLHVTNSKVRKILARYHQLTSLSASQLTPEMKEEAEGLFEYLSEHTHELLLDCVEMLNTEIMWEDLTEHDDAHKYHRGTSEGYVWFDKVKSIIKEAKPPKIPNHITRETLGEAVAQCYAAQTTVSTALEDLQPYVDEWRELEKTVEHLMAGVAACSDKQWKTNAIVALYYNPRTPAYMKIRRLEVVCAALKIRDKRLEEAYKALSRLAAIHFGTEVGDGDEGILRTKYDEVRPKQTPRDDEPVVRAASNPNKLKSLFGK